MRPPSIKDLRAAPKFLALFWLTIPTRGVQNVLLAFGICLTRIAARIGMLAHEQHSVSERELLVGPLLHGFLESGTRQEHRSRSGDDPADMQRVLVP